jgi:hypothetical protein
MFRRRSLWLAMAALIATSVACSVGGPAPQVSPPTATVSSQAVPTNTLPPIAPTNLPVHPTATESAPTSEPPQPTETSTLTATPTQTPRPRGTVATARPKQTATPLNVNYEVVEIKRKSGEEATLVLKIYASGGSGGYHYYHDDIPQSGATFNIAGTCGKPFVHTIKVTSGDGQTLAVPYHVSGVCPTPTP